MWVGLGHDGGDDRFNPRGLSHPILSFNEQHAAKDWKWCDRSHMLPANRLNDLERRPAPNQIHLRFRQIYQHLNFFRRHTVKISQFT